MGAILMKNKLRILCLILALLPLMLLAACSATKDGVSLKSEKSLKNYAQEKCPSCTFIRYETEKYKHTAYFTDDKCGFEFAVSSEVSEQYFDGAKAGYDERTDNGWHIAYYNYVLDSIKEQSDSICKKYDMTFEREKTPPTIVFLNLKSNKPYSQLKDGLVELGEAVKKADVYGKYTDFDMRVTPASEKYGTFYAFYRFKDGRTGEYDDWQAYRFMDFAEQQLGVKCTLDKAEKVKLSEVPGIEKTTGYENSNKNKEIGVYYFTTENGEKKFIADYRSPYPKYYIQDVK